MTRKLIALPLALLAAGTAGLATAAPASAGGGVTCYFTSTTTARVTSVTLPDPVDAGSTVSGVVTIDRSGGNTGAVEISLAPSSWTRTNACVFVPAGQSSVRFDVAISPVTSEGNYAQVGAYATPDGADYQGATSLIVPR
jgi:hypothetical protein